MKIKKFNENGLYKDYEEELKMHILDIIESEVEMEHIPYDSANGMEISGKSRELAAEKIIKYLKTQPNLQMFIDSGKYNI